MSAQIMTLFGSLSSSNVDERTSAASSIVFHLTQAEPLSTEEGSDVEYTHSDDLNYTLKRLVRGLASPTPGARLGFSIALCEILRRFPHLSLQATFESILAATPLQGGLKVSEERDSLFGRLFGIKAIVQSGALFPSKETSRANPSNKILQGRINLLKSIFTELKVLVRRAFWISESVGSIIVLDLTPQILRHPNSSDALNCVVEEILTDVKVWTMEQLSLVILLQQHSIKLDWSSILSKNFPDENILSKRNFDKLFSLLATGDPTCPANPSESGGQHGKTQSPTDSAIQPHFIHKIIIEASKSASGFELSSFYNQLFERYYFTEESSVSRKSHGFLILNILLTSEMIPDEDKPGFLTPNCLRTLRVQLANKDRLLHKMAQSVISNILTLVGEGNSKSSVLAKAFACQLRAFSPDFDCGSQHKLLRPLVSRMQASELELWTEELLCAFLEDSPPWSYTQPQFSNDAFSPHYPPGEFRQIMLAQLCSIISMKSSTCTPKCASSILRCLTLCAFFGEVDANANGQSVTTSKRKPVASSQSGAFITPSVPFPPALRELCKTRLYTCLSDLIEQTRPQSSVQKTKPKFPSNVDYLNGFEPLKIVLGILCSPKHDSNSLIGRESDKPIQSIRTMLSRLRSRTITIELEELQGKKRALVLLWDIVDLMTYEEQSEWLEPLPLVEQLEKDLDTLLSNDVAPKPSQNGEDSESAFANLTKCLLFLLSWPIALLRIVVEINFELFSECMGPESLRLLVDQVNPPADLPEDGDSQQESSEGEEEDEASEVESSVEEESDTDAETTTADGSIDEEFRKDVAMALGHALSKPAESNDTSDEESELMDDDEMLALDANLAAIFKRRNGKKLSRIQSTQDLHLRMKILDLIAKFVQTHPAPFMRGLLIKPLLELINKISPSEIVMKNKVTKILGDATRFPLSNLAPSQVSALLSATETSDIIQSIHLTAQTSDSLDVVGTCAKCDWWIIEMIQSKAHLFVVEIQRQAALQALVEIHKQSLKCFCFKRSKFRSDFFSPIFKRFPTFGWLLRHDLLELYIDSATLNDYRRQQMLEFISSLIRSYPPKNRLEPELLQEFDDYLGKIKQSILSLRPTLVADQMQNRQVKDREIALKNLKGLLSITNNALERRLKINPTSCSTIWSNEDIEALSTFGKQIPASSLSGIITKLIEGLIKLVRKSGIDRNGQTAQVLKRKMPPSNEDKPLETPADKTQIAGRNTKKKKKTKNNAKIH